MTLTPGIRLGPYEIIAPLGAGGMGEVYRARDPRLGREVAIKTLPAGFAADPERVARFEREAKLLASLHHPNVGSIFGLEEADGARYLVLELVEGETLAARLTRGPLPVAEALAVCEQIATAVESAHEAGVIHRDLKPGNVMLKPDGTVKVLDFGLAKTSADGAGSDPQLSVSPTMTYAATGAGVILGTAAYMSPEQARGRGVDRRTDIWSFGCVLYECLAGRPAFEGETVSDLVARILEREPDWSAVPAQVAEPVRRLLARCLTKDARERLRDIGEARIALRDARGAGSSPPPAVTHAQRRTAWRGAAIVGGVAIAGVALGALLPWLRPSPPGRATRLSVISPDADAWVGELGSYAISPDGSALVFALVDSQGTERLYLRRLDKDESRVLEGTEDARWPFWSPDSREIAFFSRGRMRRVPAVGGSVRSICAASAGRGGSWGRAGMIVFAPDPQGGLWAVEAGGGVPRQLTVVDSANGETSHRFPSFLPDGRHFLFTVNEAAVRPDAPVRVGSLDDRRTRELLRSGSAAVFAAPDRVLFTRDRALLAQRIDLRALRMSGEPRLLDDQVEVIGAIQQAPATSCAGTGVMAYTPPDRRPTTVAWLGPDGRIQGTGVRFPASVSSGSLAPDRRRLAVMEAGLEGYANWIGDLANGNVSQVAPSGKGVYGPVWNPAGTRFVGATQAGLRQIDPATGADSTLVPGDPLWRRPSSWSPDGRTLVLSALLEGNRHDVQTLTLQAGERPRPYVSTRADEGEGVLSHDGRWIAYQSDASGRREVYVQRFPDGSEAVRSGVGSPLATTRLLNRAAWRADDRELYIMGGDGYTMFATEVRTAPRLSLGTPRPVARMPREARDMILTSDGRMLVLLPVGSRPGSITVVHGWLQ